MEDPQRYLGSIPACAGEPTRRASGDGPRADDGLVRRTVAPQRERGWTVHGLQSAFRGLGSPDTSSRRERTGSPARAGMDPTNGSVELRAASSPNGSAPAILRSCSPRFTAVVLPPSKPDDSSKASPSFQSHPWCGKTTPASRRTHRHALPEC